MYRKWVPSLEDIFGRHKMHQKTDFVYLINFDKIKVSFKWLGEKILKKILEQSKSISSKYIWLYGNQFYWISSAEKFEFWYIVSFFLRCHKYFHFLLTTTPSYYNLFYWCYRRKNLVNNFMTLRRIVLTNIGS